MAYCEWDPHRHRPARVKDGKYQGCISEALMNIGNIWHVCAACAKLPFFKRYLINRPIGLNEHPGE